MGIVVVVVGRNQSVNLGKSVGTTMANSSSGAMSVLGTLGPLLQCAALLYATKRVVLDPLHATRAEMVRKQQGRHQ